MAHESISTHQLRTICGAEGPKRAKRQERAQKSKKKKKKKELNLPIKSIITMGSSP